jgi:hypothetical protein
MWTLMWTLTPTISLMQRILRRKGKSCSMMKRNFSLCPNNIVLTWCRKICKEVVPKAIQFKSNNTNKSIDGVTENNKENSAESNSKASQKSNSKKEYPKPNMDYISLLVTFRTLQLNRSIKNTLTMSQSKLGTFLMSTDTETLEYMNVPVMTPTVSVPAKFVYDVICATLAIFHADLNENIVDGVAGIWDVCKFYSISHLLSTPNHHSTSSLSFNLALAHSPSYYFLSLSVYLFESLSIPHYFSPSHSLALSLSTSLTLSPPLPPHSL